MGDEVEAKLLIMGTERERTAEAIASLEIVGGLAVVARHEHALDDAYFDTPERTLASHGLALRVRSQVGAHLVTVKGEARISDGVISRFELEVAWSPEGLRQVLAVLRDRGVVLESAFDGSEDATTAMRSLGLVAMSPRTNQRSALTLAEDGAAVAELDIDRVVFTAGSHRVRHFEVECEARSGTGPETLRAVVDDLRARFDCLRPIAYSKLEFGQLLERWATDGMLASMLEGDQLSDEAYELIERALT